MALGNNDKENSTIISLKLLAEAWPTTVRPTFEEQDSEFKPTGKTFSKISGKVIWVYTTHNGKTGIKEVKWYRAKIVDGDETYFVKATTSNASKDLFNHFAGSIGEVVNVNLYLNDKWYPTASVKLADGSHSSTVIPFNEVKPQLLWDTIKEMETPNVKWDDISIEDIPFR